MYDKIIIKLIRLYLFFVCLIKHTYAKYTKERLYYIIYTLLSVNNDVSVPFEVCKIAGVHPFCTGIIRRYVTPLLCVQYIHKVPYRDNQRVLRYVHVKYDCGRFYMCRSYLNSNVQINLGGIPSM